MVNVVENPGQQWFWWDPDWTERHGPFPSKEAALDAAHLSLAGLYDPGAPAYVGLQTPLVPTAETPAGPTVGGVSERSGSDQDAEQDLRGGRQGNPDVDITERSLTDGQ